MEAGATTTTAATTKVELPFEWRLSEQVSTASSTATVVVPSSGWYSIAFGFRHPIHTARPQTKKPSNQKTSHKRKRKHGNNNDVVVSDMNDTAAAVAVAQHMMAHLVVTPPTHEDLSQSSQQQQQPQKRSIPLPWRNDFIINHKSSSSSSSSSLSLLDDPEIFDPPSIHLGKLIWIEQHSQLALQWSPTTMNSAATAATASPARRPAPDLHIKLYRRTSKLERKTTENINVYPTPPKKAWVCPLCAKTFLTAFRLAQHQECTHVSQIMATATTTITSVTQNPNDSAPIQNSPKEENNDDDGHDLEGTTCMWTKPLTVVYDDDYLAVVNKPQGMAVMGAEAGQPTLCRSSLLLALRPSNNKTWQHGPKQRFRWPTTAVSTTATDRTNESSEPKVENQIAEDIGKNTNPADTVDKDISTTDREKQLHHQSNTNTQNDDKEKWDFYLGKPRPVHRLDAATGGLLVIAKTAQTEKALRQTFATRQCQKEYWALVYGNVLHQQGTCTQPLSGKPSVTQYRVLHRHEDAFTTLECIPETGRFHQIRRHLQMLGHAIVGDTRYGQNNHSPPSSPRSPWEHQLCLWSMAITFPHPVFPNQQVSCRLPTEPAWLTAANEEANVPPHIRTK